MAEKYVWETNLQGGGKLGGITERFADIIPTLQEYIDSKRAEGWEYGEEFLKQRRLL